MASRKRCSCTLPACIIHALTLKREMFKRFPTEGGNPASHQAAHASICASEVDQVLSNCFFLHFVMAVSAALQARRALVKLLITLASLYTVAVNLRRDSPDADVDRAFKKVFLKAHPDKGGSEEHSKQLNNAKEAWDKAKRKTGRPKESGDDNKQGKTASPSSASGLVAAASDEEVTRSFKIQSRGVLLTYFDITDDAQWDRFVSHVREQTKTWKVKHWCATLERCKTDRFMRAARKLRAGGMIRTGGSV